MNDVLLEQHKTDEVITGKNRIKALVDSLNHVQEELLALPDEMLRSIDPRDNESLEDGMAFIKDYNNRLSTFSVCARVLSEQLKEYFEVDPESDEVECDAGQEESRVRIVKELDQTEPHSLEESFTHKRPFGFVLGERAFKGLKTWKSLYLNVLDHLHELEPVRFEELHEEKRFISKRGNPFFTKDATEVRVAHDVPGEQMAEINLSANRIARNIGELLDHFGMEQQAIKIYLREDRDAAA